MKNILIWSALILISISPLYLMHINEPPAIEIGLMMVFSSILLLLFSDYKFNLSRSISLILLLPNLVLSFYIPYPINLGSILLSIAFLLIIVIPTRFAQRTGRLISAMILAGLMYSALSSFYPIYFIVFSHFHRIDILNSVSSWLLSLFGMRISINDNLLFIQTYNQTFPLSITWEKLHVLIWLNLLIIFIILSLLTFNKRKITRNLVVFTLVSSIYFIFRLIFVTILYSYSFELSVFWDRNLALLTFIPLSVPLALLIEHGEAKIDLSKLKFDRRMISSKISVFLFIFFLVGASTFEDPGIKKSGRILIDELHSDWEDTTKEMNKEWYGMLSTYNYYCWARWLDIYYDVDINTNGSLNYDLLKNYDILILKCPTDLYTDREIGDILRFVKEGGGLYLIGDHTNVFGMNFYLNQISKKVGIEFRTDATYDLRGMLSKYKPPSLFAHPIVRGLDRLDFQTSCTLEAPLTSENVIVGYGLLSEPGTYSTENFFREPLSSPDVEHGLLLQAAALKYGRGRVVAFTDSTCFSNFCIFMDGYREFNLGVIEYLNRENSYNYLNTIFLAVAIPSLMISIILLSRKSRGEILFVVMFSASTAFIFSAYLFDSINAINYGLPNIEEHPSIYFEVRHSGIEISPSANIEPYDQSTTYNTFFVWAQRSGWYPFIEKDMDRCIEKGDVVVIINPDKAFDGEAIKKIDNYIKSGGKLLVMDSIMNEDSTSNQLLNKFGMKLIRRTMDLILGNETLSVGNTTLPYLSIEGGDENVSINNDTYISIKRIGKGELLVLVDSYTFSDEVMGDVFTEPNDRLRSIYNTEYYIFDELLSKK